MNAHCTYDYTKLHVALLQDNIKCRSVILPAEHSRHTASITGIALCLDRRLDEQYCHPTPAPY